MGAVLAIDQGTTSVRATVLDTDKDGALRTVASASETIPRTFPRPAWVELDAEHIVAATERVAHKAVERAHLAQGHVLAVGLANQGETVVAWDRKTGRPIGPAIGWQCRRTEAKCRELRADAARARRIRALTGLPIDPYFSATKIAWLLDEVQGARARANKGDIAVGTLDSYTLFRLSGGAAFVTDPSTACRTLLATLDDGRFSSALCDELSVPRGILAEVVPSDAVLPSVSIGGLDLPVRALLCDQPSAMLGTGCATEGDVKCTYGTGAFVQVHTGASHRMGDEDDGLLRSVAWELRGVRTYLLEGGVLTAGDVLTWLVDDLGLIARPDALDDLLAGTHDAAGVSFLPALTGLGAPHWVGDARGAVLGLHRGVTRAHLVRAALEGVAHEVADILEAAALALGRPLAPMWADGGLAASTEFLELQADLAGMPLRRSPRPEATTHGIAAVAAVSAGLSPSIEAALHAEQGPEIVPTLDATSRREQRARHARLIEVATSKAVLDLHR